MKRPSFTREQLEWLRGAMRPGCCHVSGEHDPTHFREGRYVCDMQKRKAYDALRRLLGFAEVKPADAVPSPGCGWCEERIARGRQSGGRRP